MRFVWERAASAAVRAAVVTAIGAATVVAVAGPAGAQDPPGNNGTVKVDDLDIDTIPENAPHQGCEFLIEFRGYDEGDLTGTVDFYAVPPTADGGQQPGVLLLHDELQIGEDPAGGANDLDASEIYDLTEFLAGFTPHPQQGWHVRLEVHAEGSIGADTKFKVFWVDECEVPTSTTSTSTTSTSTTSTSTTSSTSTTMIEGTTTTSETVPGATTTPGQPGTSVSPVATTTPSGGGGLPVTGSNSVPLAAAALALVGVGAGVVVAARRLRPTSQG